MRRPWVGLGIVAAMVVASLVAFEHLPAEVPTHWNVRGEVDARAGRWPGAFIGPLVGLGIWLLLWFLPRIDPRREHYRQFWSTYWTLGNLILLFLALLHGLALGAALGVPIDVTTVVLAAVGVFFMILGHYLPRVRSNWWFGVRTPWTLESERVWRETHRLAGRTLMIGGGITLASLLLPEEIRPWMAMGGIAVGALVPVVYSYFAWRRDRRQRSA